VKIVGAGPADGGGETTAAGADPPCGGSRSPGGVKPGGKDGVEGGVDWAARPAACGACELNAAPAAAGREAAIPSPILARAPKFAGTSPLGGTERFGTGWPGSETSGGRFCTVGGRERLA